MSNVLNLKGTNTPAEQSAEPEPEAVKASFGTLQEASNDSAAAVVEAIMGPQALSWEAHHPLSASSRRKHRLLMAGLGILGIFTAWTQSSWLTLAAVLLGLVAWELYERLEKPTQVALDERGVWVDGYHYAHAELSSFDIHTMPDNTNELSIKPQRWSTPHLHLPLGDQNIEEVRAALAQFVVHDRHPVSFIDWHLRKQ